MIKNIPTSEDFITTGLSLLNIAWDNLMGILTQLENAKSDDEVGGKQVDAFWESSKIMLSSSLVIVQHGFELIIKGKILGISPYILIARDPKNWPKKCDTVIKDFSDFQTIESQYLIKVYNAVSDSPFPKPLIKPFDRLRKTRNIIMHTIDKKLPIEFEKMIIDILLINKYLSPNPTWIKNRENYLNNCALQNLYDGYPCYGLLIYEFVLILDILKPKQMEDFFCFNKNQRRYVCVSCQGELRHSLNIEHETKTAILKPNEPTSTNIFCFICGNHDVIRKKCENKTCKGNVILVEDHVCCTCGTVQNGI